MTPRHIPSASRGYSLIEVMLVVAITGVLGALAIYSMTAYLEAARTAEAKNFVRAIGKGAQASYERESSGAEVLVDGAPNVATHRACQSATPVPAAIPESGAKYQPNTADGHDFQTGDADGGWRCLKFQTSDPIYFQYSYYWQDTTVSVAQRDWQRHDWSAEPTDPRTFVPATKMMAALPNDKGDNGKGTNKDGGLDGDGNNGHGDNDDGCDPDNPGKSKHCDGKGDNGGDETGSGNDGDGGDAGGEDVEPAGDVEPWCMEDCWEAGAKGDKSIFLSVTKLVGDSLVTSNVILYRK